jgi:probable phosphoglycerate mutase
VTDESTPDPGTTARREQRTRAEHGARLVLLRHGEPDWAPDGTSVPDPGLTPFGRAQAAAAAARLAAEGVDAIYVSPYRRAQETAAPLVKATGLIPQSLPGLAEISVAVDGLSQEAADRYFVEASQRPLAEHWEGWPGAESFHDFHARVTEAVEALLARHGFRHRRDAEHDFTQWDLDATPARIAIVAHGGTNAVAITHLLDIDCVPWEWNRFEMELAAYAVVQSRPVGMTGFIWSLQNFNEIDHLRSAELR